ncbi:DNA alkylation repair protein [Nocardia pseudovaccinii]|uniref:DNA alkylation repair protein n=1 Tax=Nocardia pseudovaccinii TaxID=189540 RepID=UPI0007A40825|nr:DNA alkylation repair protein [Nocardia pseudovaccinii]
MDAVTAGRVSSLVTDVEDGLREHADPDYVAGTVAARSPGKPVLGVRIPLLRGAVKAGLESAGLTARNQDPVVVFGAADALWHGSVHEAELAGSMMLRLTDLRMPAPMILRWALLLDNWLSVDELGGVVGMSLVDDPALLHQLHGLAVSPSVWQRRLYVVSLIRPVKAGLSPTEVPELDTLLGEKDPAIRKACVWLINEAIKARSTEAAAQFRELVPGAAPKTLVRILDAALV